MNGPRRNPLYMQSYVATGCKRLASAPSLLLHALKLHHSIMEALFLGLSSVLLQKSLASGRNAFICYTSSHGHFFLLCPRVLVCTS